MDTRQWQQTPPKKPDTPRCCLRMFETACWPFLVSFGASWCLLAFCVVWKCLIGVWGDVQGIWVMFMDIWNPYVCLVGYLSAQPLKDRPITLLWNSPERQDILNLTIVTHQNIKMSTCKLYKNGWVMPFFYFLMPIRGKLKNTVFLNHPVVW